MVLFLRRLHKVGLCLPIVVIAACSGGNSGGTTEPEEPLKIPTSTPRPTATLAPTPTPTPIPTATPTPIPGEQVSISGRVTFDLVPYGAGFHSGLDYDNTQPAPVQGATVQLLSQSGAVQATGVTDSDGIYGFIVPVNTLLAVRVLAQVAHNNLTYEVVDNINDKSLYALVGSLKTSGEADSIRNLHAASGWDLTENSYTEARSAAPFSILDAVGEALEILVSADPGVRLPSLQLNWSPENIAISGDAPGEITTSKYVPGENSNDNDIYILGHADNDTDEYDRDVVQHEFGHFLEYRLWRTNNIGGSHNLTTRHDMRLAFGEGFANAFAAHVDGTGRYMDTSGESQGDKLVNLNLEVSPFHNRGWYSEASVGRIVYDLLDDNDDGVDTLSLGFKGLYRAFRSSEYRDTETLTSIYLFAHALKETLDNPQQEEVVNALLEDENIFGVFSKWGSGESNNGGSSIVLPIYSSLTLGETVNVCTDKVGALDNGFDVHRFVRFSLSQTRTINVRVTRSEGLIDADPEMHLFPEGFNSPYVLSSSDSTFEDVIFQFEAGDYVLEVFDKSNAGSDADRGGRVCFDVTVE